jgi:hypothetical protein
MGIALNSVELLIRFTTRMPADTQREYIRWLDGLRSSVAWAAQNES